MCEEAGAHGENLRVQAGNPHIHSHTTTVDHGLGSNSGRSGDKQVHFKTKKYLHIPCYSLNEILKIKKYLREMT